MRSATLGTYTSLLVVSVCLDFVPALATPANAQLISREQALDMTFGPLTPRNSLITSIDAQALAASFLPPGAVLYSWGVNSGEAMYNYKTGEPAATPGDDRVQLVVGVFADQQQASHALAEAIWALSMPPAVGLADRAFLGDRLVTMQFNNVYLSLGWRVGASRLRAIAEAIVQDLQTGGRFSTTGNVVTAPFIPAQGALPGEEQSAVVGPTGLASAGEKNRAQALRAVFEQKYQAWLDYIEQPEVASSSNATVRWDCVPFQEIVALGVPALPLILEKMDEGASSVHQGSPYSRFLSHAFTVIMNTHTQADLSPQGWWETVRPQVPQRFAELFAERQAALAQGDNAKAQQTVRQIRNELGALAVPLLVEKIQAGEPGLIPTLALITRGAVAPGATLEQVTTWWEQDQARWILPSEAEQPAAE